MRTVLLDETTCTGCLTPACDESLTSPPMPGADIVIRFTSGTADQACRRRESRPGLGRAGRPVGARAAPAGGRGRLVARPSRATWPARTPQPRPGRPTAILPGKTSTPLLPTPIPFSPHIPHWKRHIRIAHEPRPARQPVAGPDQQEQRNADVRRPGAHPVDPVLQ